jgi:hypothetical protein
LKYLVQVELDGRPSGVVAVIQKTGNTRTALRVFGGTANGRSHLLELSS